MIDCQYKCSRIMRKFFKSKFYKEICEKHLTLPAVVRLLRRQAVRDTAQDVSKDSRNRFINTIISIAVFNHKW